MGEQPLVNSLIEEKDLAKKEPTFPLVVERCSACSLIQIVDPVPAEKIYRDVDYLYFSGDMPGLPEYFYDYAKEIREICGLKPEDFVVEIGSNDGTMLSYFPHCLGVDPSTNVVVRAVEKGIPSVSDFFTERLARSIVREFGRARVVYGNNCIAHVHDLGDLLRGANLLLEEGGFFVVECNYWGSMVRNLNYSLIYHDHFSYFSLKNWKDVGERVGLSIFDARVTPAQGGSLRVYLKKGSCEASARAKELLDAEEKEGLGTEGAATRFRTGVLHKAGSLGERIRSLKANGKTIAGYGAAAKGFSILSLAGITNEISYFVDDSPAKQWKYTPINHIPVYPRKYIPKDPDIFIITAPNYEKQIRSKEKDYGGEFIVP